jgi:hypothetical protein
MPRPHRFEQYDFEAGFAPELSQGLLCLIRADNGDNLLI